MTSPSAEYMLKVGNASAPSVDMASPGTGGSVRRAVNFVGATSSTSRVVGVGNRTSYRAISTW